MIHSFNIYPSSIIISKPTPISFIIFKYTAEGYFTCIDTYILSTDDMK